MPNTSLLFISDPRPELSDKAWDLYLQTLNTVGTGRGLPFKRPKPRTVPAEWSYLYDNPAPLIAYATGCYIRPGTLYPRIPLAGLDVVYETHQGEHLDDQGFVLPFEEGAEVVMSAYRDAERTRRSLECKFVQGWRLPEDRFRPFSQEPYFPDTYGTFTVVGRDASRWNDYTLERT